ncbi:hypothetical protein N8482_01125 [Chitinophagales bacterium]|nr:hypothetical protein [Chitinophagales bacterium]
MKILNHILRWLVGLFMLFSGTVKAIDPVGTSIKMKEYFEVFTEYFEFLTPLWELLASVSLPFSIFMIALEIILGILLLLDVWRKTTMFTLFAMMLFFTFLTGFTLWTGKVTDCGCFGDFLKLEPYQTFNKDVALVLIIALMWFLRSKWTQLNKAEAIAFGIAGAISAVLGAFILNSWTGGFVTILIVMLISALIYTFIHNRDLRPSLRTIAAAVLCIAAIAFTLRNVMNLPIVDFRAYKVGTDLVECTNTDGLDQGEVIVKFEVEKDGQTKTVASEEFGAVSKDGWKYKDRIDEVIREPELPPCKDFIVVDDDGNEYQEDVLTHAGYSMWVTSYDVTISSDEGFDKVNQLVASVKDRSVNKLGLTGTAIPTANTKTDGAYGFYNLDAVPIKTINRSNPGLLILKDQVVVAKYHYNHLPSPEELKATFGIE